MSTSALNCGRTIMQRFIDKSINENFPKSYKRSIFISTLIYLFNNNNHISDHTFKKIIKLFEMGLRNEKNLKYCYYFKNYAWNNLIKDSKTVYKNKEYDTIYLIQLYKNETIVFDIKDLDNIVDNIFEKIPEYLRYGSDKLLKFDIRNIIQFVKYDQAF